MYLVRQQTDLIPFVQLRMPTIDFAETAIFAGISALVFVLLGVTFGIYELFVSPIDHSTEAKEDSKILAIKHSI